MDISPINTLINWGNSSRLDMRKNLPILVMRGSLSEACRSLAFLLTCMVLSLKQLKVRPLYPVRFCRKKTGPLESNLIRIASKGNNQERMVTVMTSENRMSIVRLVMIKLSFLPFTASLSCSLFSRVNASLSKMALVCVSDSSKILVFCCNKIIVKKWLCGNFFDTRR